MRTSDLLIYTRQANLEASGNHNEYFYEDFSNKNPFEALPDFNREQYFPGKTYLTRDKSPKEQIATVRNFVGNHTPQQKAISKLLLARGGQALSKHAYEQVSEHVKLSDKFASEYFASKNKDCIFTSPLELSFFTHTGQKDSVMKHTIHLHYRTISNNTCLYLNPTTGKLEEIDPNQFSEFDTQATALKHKFLTDEKFKSLQTKIAQNTDPLIIAKVVEKIIKDEFGYLPICIASESVKITGLVNPLSYDQLPLKLFSCNQTRPNGRKSIETDKLPKLYKAKVAAYLEQTDFFIATNTDDVKIDSELVSKNTHSAAEKEDVDYRKRNLDSVLNVMNGVSSIPPAPTEKKFFEQLMEFFDTIKRLIQEVICSARNHNDSDREIKMSIW